MTYLKTKDLQKTLWKVSRGTLFKMRQNNHLVELVHYVKTKINGKEIIFYNSETIENGLVNGFDSLEHKKFCLEVAKK